MASKQTITAVIEVLQKHLTKDQIVAIMNDLREIKGNKSFQDTIKVLQLAALQLSRPKT